MLVFSGLLSFLGFVAVRYRTRLITGAASRWTALRRSNLIGERVLIVGGGDVGQFTTWLIFNGPLSRAFSVVGMVDDDPRKSGLRISGCKVLGDTTKISELTKKYDVGVILFAIERIEPNQRQRLLSICRATGVQMIVIPDVLTHLREEFSKQHAILSSGNGNGNRHNHNGNGNGNSNGNGNGNGHHHGDNEIGFAKRVSSAMPVDMNDWLASLEILAENQDWDTLRARLKEMQMSVNINQNISMREQE